MCFTTVWAVMAGLMAARGGGHATSSLRLTLVMPELFVPFMCYLSLSLSLSLSVFRSAGLSFFRSIYLVCALCAAPTTKMTTDIAGGERRFVLKYRQATRCRA